jgi:hypothetical protein
MKYYSYKWCCSDRKMYLPKSWLNYKKYIGIIINKKKEGETRETLRDTLKIGTKTKIIRLL